MHCSLRGETFNPLVPDVRVIMMRASGVSAVTNDVRVVWVTLTDWLTLWWSDGWLQTEPGRPLTPLRPEPESSVNRLRRVGSRCAQAGRREERGIDKSKTLITTGYSASPVNMGLIWGCRPTMGRPLLVLSGHHKQRHVQSRKMPLAFVLINGFYKILFGSLEYISYRFLIYSV